MILGRLSKLVNTFDVNGGIFAISSIRLKQKYAMRMRVPST